MSPKLFYTHSFYLKNAKNIDFMQHIIKGILSYDCDCNSKQFYSMPFILSPCYNHRKRIQLRTYLSNDHQTKKTLNIKTDVAKQTKKHSYN